MESEQNIVNNKPETESAGLYIHVPFCKSKCPYCDFYSTSIATLIPAWLEAVKKEMRFYGDRFTSFDTIYIGGGTPSLLTNEQVDDLLACLRQHFSFADDTEITLEANPDDLNLEKLTALRELGINRLSLGAQSFNDQELRFLKRRHTADQTREALGLLRQAGFTNLGVDLIYGLPGQTEAIWLQTLEEAVGFQPEHLSCYQLTLEQDTLFGQMQAQKKLMPLEEEQERAFFLLTANFLGENGYMHYEISNFARIESVCSRHNRKYWQHVPYLGLGPAAHSFQGGVRWWNHRSIAKYLQATQDGQEPVAESETLSPAQLRLEAIYLGLRTNDGIAFDLIRVPDSTRILAEYKAAGLIMVHNGKVRLTREGFAVADSLTQMLSD